jgi:hypothetical protein
MPKNKKKNQQAFSYESVKFDIRNSGLSIPKGVPSYTKSAAALKGFAAAPGFP